MKQIGIDPYMVMSVVFLVLIVSGCMSVSSSPTPRFYVLAAGNEAQLNKKVDVLSNIFVGVGPVKIPEYQNRPQMVTLDKENLLNFAQFDRWGESLDVGLARLIREDLAVMLPGAKFTAYPWDSFIPVKYQVAVEIVQLDSVLDKDVFLVVQWMVIDTRNTKPVIIKRSEFRQPVSPQTYSGFARTLSAVCVALSQEIAQAIAELD